MNELLIEARQAKPRQGKGEAPLLPVDCALKAGSCTFLLADDLATAGAYMHMLAAVERPEEGDMIFFGKAEVELDTQEWNELRKRLGYVDEAIPLLSVLSGIENVKLPARYHHVCNEDEIRLRTEALIDAMDYQADQRVLPAYMSTLQRRHLTIARALMLEPDILFVNDPFNDLSPKERQMIATFLITQARQRNMALVVATDDPELVHDYADTVLFYCNEGMLKFRGWTELLASDHQEVQTYLEQLRQRHRFLTE